MNWHDSTLPFDLEDLQLIGDSLFVVGVPIDMPEEFKVRVFAAAKSYTMRNKSIDYTLKRYGRHWSFERDDTDSGFPVVALCRLVRASAIDTISYLMSIQDKPDLPNVFACTAAIFRLKNTFRAAVLCIRNGMRIEAATLCRVILEQLAWISAIYSLTADHDSYTELTPQSCIASLKRFVPQVGKLYGTLSETSHLHFEATLSYIKVRGDDLAVRIHDHKLCALHAVQLLHLIDWLEIIGEHVYGDLIPSPRSTLLNEDGSRSVRADRRMVEVINEAERLFSTVPDA
jgi:hypothetical protein